ncbi:response regulator [Cohnella yongneupensis]|uniref:Response regulator n=1 Tax=Cohnella yongneupensis TaxID=425006 RepID=A0ABW0R1C9_9BACL
MTRTLLIADDERNIRLGLRAMIERQYPGQYHIMLAADGVQALEEFERQPAEIVITDIRMPELDGIGLIKELSGLPAAPALLILSGYDDFQFAKEAMKHKVRDYLLKPIVREDLFAALERLEQDLAARQELLDKLASTDRYREGLRVRTLEAIWAEPSHDEAAIRDRCIEAGLHAFEPLYHVAIVDTAGNQRLAMKIREAVGGRELGDQTILIENKDNQLILLAQGTEIALELSKAMQAAAGNSNEMVIGISTPGQSIGEVKTRFEEARQAIKYRLLFGRPEKGVIRYGQIKDRNRGIYVPLETVRKLANMMGTDREAEIKALLLELFYAKALDEADIGYFEAVSRALNELVFDRVFNAYGEASVDIIRMYRKAGNLYHFASIQDYIRCVEGLLFDLNDFVGSLKSAHIDSKEMARALEYIHATFDRDISMAMVSNHVSLNYSYFSERFKEFTGESFIGYLKKLRIAKAKELLETTDDRVYEISRRVGYDNPKQFNRVFRELEGITAQEYRHKSMTEKR